MPGFTAPDGLNLHYTDEGTGQPILCLSGLTRNGSDFSYVTPHLSDCRLIKLDYRGRGQSDWAEDFTTYAVPNEAQDAMALLDHLGLERVAVLGTSRGGLVAMVLAAMAPGRVTGIAFNDIGPVIEPAGLDVIMGYLGRNPVWDSYETAAREMPKVMAGFANVPQDRWMEEARKLYVETPDGLKINYDPKLRDAIVAASHQPTPDLWPLFDAVATLSLAVIRGANSNLLSADTVTEMTRRAPGLIAAEVPDRGHIPYLDEAEAVRALRGWLERLP